MHTLATTTHFIINALMIVMLMKLVLKPKDFYFSPILRPFDALAEPILKRLRKLFRPTRTGWDATPLIAIGILLCIQTVFMLFHVSLDPVGAITLSIRTTILFLFQFGIVCAIVSMSIPSYVANPLARFFVTFLRPLERFISPFTSSRLIRFVSLLVILILMTTMVLHFLFAVHHPRNSVVSENEMNGLAALSFQTVMRSGILWLVSVVTVMIQAVQTYHFFIMMLMTSAVISWVNFDPRNPLVQLVFSITEPILIPFRRVIPSMSGLDFSPVIAIVVISMLGNLACRGLLQLQFMLISK